MLRTRDSHQIGSETAERERRSRVSEIVPIRRTQWFRVCFGPPVGARVLREMIQPNPVVVAPRTIGVASWT